MRLILAAIAICLLHWSSLTTAGEWITEFSPEYKRMLDSLGENPSETIESLLAVDELALPETERAQWAHVISSAYVNLTYPAEALSYAQKSIDLVTLSAQPWLFHTFSLQKASALILNAIPAQGIGPASDALEWALANEDSALELDARNKKGVLLLALQDYSGALENHLAAYKIAEAMPDSTNLKAETALWIAWVYYVRGDWELAIPYFEESLAHDRITGDKTSASEALFGLGGAYKGLGDIETAIKHYAASVRITQELGDVQGEAFSLAKLAIINLEERRYSEAEEQLLNVLDTFILSENKRLQIRIHVALVDLYIETGNFDAGGSHLVKANKLLAPDSMKLERPYIKEAEAKFLSATGKHEQAYKLLSATMMQHKEILNQKSNEQLHQIRARYEIESASRENRLLEQQNQLQEAELRNSSSNITQLRFIILLSTLLCGTFVYLIYRSRMHEESLENKVKERTKELSFALDRVREYDRAKSQFLANMSHEIRTPMNGIIGMVELLQKTPLAESQNRFVGFISNSASQLLILINDILDLSRIESGKIQLTPKRFHLPTLLDETVQFYSSEAKKKGLSLELEDTTNLTQELVSDEGRLRQILVNLLGNAIKFTEAGGVIVTVSIAEEQEDSMLASFSISDTGIGVDEASLDTIFESFSQADTSTTRLYGGSGLGLAISRQMVELLGGEMFVDSTVGSGSTFRFTARLEKEVGTFVKQEVPDEPVKAAAKMEKLAGAHILMCEDNEINQEVTRLHLERLGCHVEIAEDGQAGLERFEKGNYDMILMDCHMPRMDGFEATRSIRNIESKRRSSARIPIVACTAFAMEGDRERCIDAGMDNYLSKPFTIEQLAQVLNTTIT